MARVEAEEWCSEVDEHYGLVDHLAMVVGVALLVVGVTVVAVLSAGVLWGVSRLLQAFGV